MASPKHSEKLLVPITKIPSIAVLYEQLGFQRASAKVEFSFLNACRAWRKSYTTRSGHSGSELLLWKESYVQRGLSEMAKGFVGQPINRESFWGTNRSWKVDSSLELPKDEKEIIELLKQLFWKQNRYAHNNTTYVCPSKLSPSGTESSHVDGGTLFPRVLTHPTRNTRANQVMPNYSSPRKRKRQNPNHASVAGLDDHAIESPTSRPQQENHGAAVSETIESGQMIVASQRFRAPIAPMIAANGTDNGSLLLLSDNTLIEQQVEKPSSQTPREPLLFSFATKHSEIQDASHHSSSFSACTDISEDTVEEIREQIVPTASEANNIANQNSRDATITIAQTEVQVQTSLYVVTFEPLRTLEQWDEGNFQRMGSTIFIQKLIERIGRSDFEKVILTLDASPLMRCKVTIPNNNEKEWQSKRRFFQRRMEETIAKAKLLKKGEVDFDIFVEPIHNKVELPNLIDEVEMGDIIVEF